MTGGDPLDAAWIASLGREAGLCATGVCRAEPFTRTARVLRERKKLGLHGGMQFTYRNPERATDPSGTVPGATAIVVGALDWHRPQRTPPDDGKPRARVAAYATDDHYARLRRALTAVAEPLRARGYRAVVVADENHQVDRAVAHRAGIGWWGKSANILVPGAGSMVVLGSVVTDAPITGIAPEPVADGCGGCRACLAGCPTGAIVAPGVVDARRCLAWMVQADGVFDARWRVALGDRIYGCDDCGDVCPPNRIRVRRSRREAMGLGSGTAVAGAPSVSGAPRPAAQPADGSRGGPAGWVLVLDLLASSDSELMDAYGRWYIPRRQPRYLRRNALVVLGNIGDPSQPEVRAAVNRALADPDPLVAAHAVWCARRLGLGLGALVGREHPLIRAEVQRDVPPRPDLSYRTNTSGSHRCSEMPPRPDLRPARAGGGSAAQ